MRYVATVVLAVLLLAGCGPDDQPTSAPAAPTSPPVATAAPRPADGACYRLTFDEAVSPTNATEAGPCDERHTSQTYLVGDLDNLVRGHLLAVDSARVQQQVARACPDAFARFVGGTEDQRRLSMLKPVWFTPTVEESDDGADWFRCDVVALAGSEGLTPVTGSLHGVLGRPAGRARYAMCGTDRPTAADFQRVPCSARHSWRAISVVSLPRGDYPGAKAVQARGAGPCRNAGARVAEDPLDYQWAYEGPDEAQWNAGQTYGRCWSPDAR